MQRCMGCMREFGDAFDVCPHCGYIVGTEAASRNHLAPGTVLQNRYTLGKALGQGGFGITYIAWDEKLSRSVAVKEYMPNALASRMTGEKEIACFNEEARRQFELGLKKTRKETVALSRFGALESVVKVYDCIEENGTAYIIMELLRGDTARDILSARGKLTFEDTMRIMTPVLETLDAMHKAGMIHRDVAPDNIFVCEDGKIKLLDFGAARVISGADNKTLSVVLKAGYAPVEQYSSKGRQGAFTDVYAAAATMYNMLTGKTPPDSLDRVEEDVLVPLGRLCSVPVGAEQAIRRAMAVRASDRTQTAAAFLDELDNALSAGQDAEPPADKSSSRTILLAVCITAVVLIAAAAPAIIGLFNKKQPEPEPSSVPAAAVQTQLSFAAVGDVITFGAYEQDNNAENGKEPVEWLILDVQSGQYLAVSRYALDCQPYHSAAENTSWSECTLRYWLNHSFLYDAFSAEERNTISTVRSPLSDKIFVLSKEETLQYFPSSAERKTSATGTAAANGSYQENGSCGWWLRDTGDTSRLAARVNIDGDIVSNDSSEGGVERRDYSVRPAVWLSADEVEAAAVTTETSAAAASTTAKPAATDPVTENTLIALPNVVGMAYNDACQRLTALGFTVSVTELENDGSQPAGTVIRMNPSATHQCPKGTNVQLQVYAEAVTDSFMAQPIWYWNPFGIGDDSGENEQRDSIRGILPSVEGRSYDEAVDLLRSAGFTNIRRNDIATDDPAENDLVFQQNPPYKALTRYAYSTEIELTVYVYAENDRADSGFSDNIFRR